MPRIFLLLLFISVSFAQAGPRVVDTAFKKMLSLEGEWEGKDAGGNPAKSTFKQVVSGTTLIETLSSANMEEMLSLYSVDGDGIQLTHYCPTNNQPRMRAVPSADVNELDFQFIAAGNLRDPSVGHQHRLIIRFEDADHITESWTWKHDSHEMPMVFHFSRKHK